MSSLMPIATFEEELRYLSCATSTTTDYDTTNHSSPSCTDDAASSIGGDVDAAEGPQVHIGVHPAPSTARFVHCYDTSASVGFISPAVSVATQTTDVVFTLDSPRHHHPQGGASGFIAPMEATMPLVPVAAMIDPLTGLDDNDDYPSDDFVEAVFHVVKSLSEAGDAYWLSQGRKRLGKSTATDTARAALYNLRDNGLFSRPVGIATVLYLKRLVAVDAKFLSHFTILRYTIVACVVANKVCGDTYFPLQCYSDLCPLSRSTIVAAEIALLQHLEYDVQLRSKALGVDFGEVSALLGTLTASPCGNAL